MNEPGKQRSQEADEPGGCPKTKAESAVENQECSNQGDPEQTSQIDLERLLQIRQKIDSGYYDQIWVKEKIIDSMIDEMLRNISEFYK